MSKPDFIRFELSLSFLGISPFSLSCAANLKLTLASINSSSFLGDNIHWNCLKMQWNSTTVSPFDLQSNCLLQEGSVEVRIVGFHVIFLTVIKTKIKFCWQNTILRLEGIVLQDMNIWNQNIRYCFHWCHCCNETMHHTVIPWHGDAFLHRPLCRKTTNYQWILRQNTKVSVVAGFDVYFFVSMNKLLNKQPSCQWFEMSRGSCDIAVMVLEPIIWRPLCFRGLSSDNKSALV